MATRLTAYVDGRRIGWFEAGGGRPSLTFDDDWRGSAGRMELSLSLPKSRREHRGPEVENFLWNLLPDNDNVLRRWANGFGVSERNAMGLLSHVGLDVAGAVQLSADDGARLDRSAKLEQISTDDIRTHIRALHDNPFEWILPGAPKGYFSLAGAQSKFALTRTPDGWAMPSGAAASTHIFKPGIRGLAHSDLNEHLSLAAAANLGLETAHSEVVEFDGEHAIVSQRYDRVLGKDGTVGRLHQEDLAQASGIHPAVKYESDGGPGIRQIGEILRDSGGADSDRDVERFYDAILYNWAVLGTDAHAKNYALLHDADAGPRLAPLYDVASALPYPTIAGRDARLAMSMGKHYRAHEIAARYLGAEAKLIGLNPDAAIARAREIAEHAPDAFRDAAADANLIGDSAAFAARLVDDVAERTARLVRALDAETTPVVTATSQLRNKDVGRAGNGGAFTFKTNTPPVALD